MQHEWLRSDGRLKPDLLSKKGVFDRLDAGPWFWPRDDQKDLWDVAIGARPDGPRNPPPGIVPLVTVGNRAPGLWVLGKGTTPFHDTARDAWRTAICAIPRCVPLIWPRDGVLRAEDLKAQRFHGRGGYPDGSSFGVSFALAAVSRTLDLSVPADLIASAALDPWGVLHPVQRLEQKIAVVASNAPQICRFIVCAEQRDKAVGIASAYAHLEIVGCKTLTEALAITFGDDLEFAATAQVDPRRRPGFVESTFRLALGRRDDIAEWDPVIRAAVGGADWDLSKTDRLKLNLAKAIAERHQGNRGDLPLPPDDWFDTLRQPLRLDAIAHVVQQSADTGSPSLDDAQRLAARYLEGGRGKDAFPQHLRLLGAFGRLLYARGDYQTALDVEREAVIEWMERWEWTEVSYALSFAYLIAGVLCDGTSLDELERLESDWRRRVGPCPSGEAYVDLAHARALFECGRASEAEPLLRPLLASHDVPGHVKRSAKFWLGRALTEMGDSAQGAQLWDTLEQETSGQLSTAGDLCALHRRQCSEALERLLDGQFVARQIRDAAQAKGECAMEALVRRFPY